jgi:hypothetical protein
MLDRISVEERGAREKTHKTNEGMSIALDKDVPCSVEMQMEYYPSIGEARVVATPRAHVPVDIELRVIGFDARLRADPIC